MSGRSQHRDQRPGQEGAADPEHVHELLVGGQSISDAFKTYRKTSDMIDPGPARTAVLLDEREDSINDGFFVIDMTGYPNQPAAWQLVDVPASYHSRAGGFSFADGHSEIKKWQDSRTCPPIQRQNLD